jgi:hypothetical protein
VWCNGAGLAEPRTTKSPKPEPLLGVRINTWRRAPI